MRRHISETSRSNDQREMPCSSRCKKPKNRSKWCVIEESKNYYINSTIIEALTRGSAHIGLRGEE